jgi:hypothetical protein
VTVLQEVVTPVNIESVPGQAWGPGGFQLSVLLDSPVKPGNDKKKPLKKSSTTRLFCFDRGSDFSFKPIVSFKTRGL